jgi:hypothetical protein
MTDAPDSPDVPDPAENGTTKYRIASALVPLLEEFSDLVGKELPESGDDVVIALKTSMAASLNGLENTPDSGRAVVVALADLMVEVLDAILIGTEASAPTPPEAQA